MSAVAQRRAGLLWLADSFVRSRVVGGVFVLEREGF